MALPSQLDCQLLKSGTVFLMFPLLSLVIAMILDLHIVDAQLTAIYCKLIHEAQDLGCQCGIQVFFHHYVTLNVLNN